MSPEDSNLQKSGNRHCILHLTIAQDKLHTNYDYHELFLLKIAMTDDIYLYKGQ
jgi:hypothetical protein